MLGSIFWFSVRPGVGKLTLKKVESESPAYHVACLRWAPPGCASMSRRDGRERKAEPQCMHCEEGQNWEWK